MKRFLMVAALACALPISAAAGDIPSDGLMSGSDESTSLTTNTVPGEIPSVPYQDQMTSTLDVIQILIGLTI